LRSPWGRVGLLRFGRMWGIRGDIYLFRDVSPMHDIINVLRV
jgi:hypothetical protein